MTDAKKRISFDEFSENLTRIFERVISEGESIVIEKGEGKLVEVRPITPTKSARGEATKADDEAFLSAAGGWVDVDIDSLDKQTALAILREHWAELRGYHVKSLAIFGSVARDEAGPGSDVDILVEFDQPVGLIAYSRLQRRLSEILNCRVDLATPAALRDTMRDEILNEAVYA